LFGLAFDAAQLAPFLEFFYAGRRVPSELASGRYRVGRSGNCGFLYPDMPLNEEGMQSLDQVWLDHQRSLRKKIKTVCALVYHITRCSGVARHG